MSRPLKRRWVSGFGRGLAGALALALGALWPPATLAAQSVEELVQRLDSLQPLLEQAEIEADRARRRARMQAQEALGISLDTILVGPLTIVTPEEQVPDARRAFESVWERVAPLVGDATHALEDGLWIFQYGPRLYPIRLPFRRPGENVVQSIKLRSWEPWERVMSHVEASVWGMLALPLEGEVRRVVASGPWRAREPEFLEMAYRELVTAPSRPARACVDGEVDACWTAMGARGLPESWETWYDPAERRAFVLRSGRRGSAYRSCERGDQEACDRLLESEIAPVVPLEGVARSGIVGYALDLGGEGSYARLVAAGDVALDVAVSRAAGLGEDEVMRRWRALVLESRSAVGGGGSRSQWSALLWMVILGTLAMGSTRWRLG